MRPTRPLKSSDVLVPPKRSRPRKKNPVQSEAAGERPRIYSAEEKRQLILAHANREPVDSVQRFSLWAGVTVCVLVIAVGWIYSMRQTIASAFDSSAVSQVTDEFSTSKDGTNLQENLGALMQHLDAVQAKGTAEIKTLQAVAEQVHEVASSSAARQDLFKPAKPNPGEAPSLPPGVIIENY